MPPRCACRSSTALGPHHGRPASRKPRDRFGTLALSHPADRLCHLGRGERGLECLCCVLQHSAAGVRLEPRRRGQRLFGQPTGARRQRPVYGRTARPLRPTLVIPCGRDHGRCRLDRLWHGAHAGTVHPVLWGAQCAGADGAVPGDGRGLSLVSADATWPGDRLGGCRHRRRPCPLRPRRRLADHHGGMALGVHGRRRHGARGAGATQRVAPSDASAGNPQPERGDPARGLAYQSPVEGMPGT